MKYIDAEKLKAHIEAKMEILWDKLPDADKECPTDIELRDLGMYMAMEGLIDDLDSLQQEQPEVDLEKYIENEINHYGLSLYEASYGMFSASQIDRIIRNAFELGQREMRRRITNPEYNAKVVERLKSEYPATKEEKKWK